MSAESYVVCVEQYVVCSLTNHKAVACVRAVVGEVEHEEQVTALIGQHLITIVVPDLLNGCLLDVLLHLQHSQHSLVEVAEIVEAELVVIHQIPLAAGIFVAPAVAFAGEVYPFGMTELITHEVQITAVDSAGREQTDHLVQGDTALYIIVLIALLEMPVHIGINQAEDDGLVTHQCLIVALTVRDGLLVGTTIGYFPEHRTGLPVFITQLLDYLNPIVGDIHGHAVVEAIAAILEGSCQTGHSAHLFCDGDGVGIHLMDDFVGKREIADGVVILMSVIVVSIAADRSFRSRSRDCPKRDAHGDRPRRNTGWDHLRSCQVLRSHSSQRGCVRYP